MSNNSLSNILRSPIARKLILYVIVFSSLITLAITAAQLYYDYSVELNNIHNSLEDIETVHLNTLTANVWAVDRENASIQLEGILEIPDLEYLEITENGRLWLKAGFQESKNVIEKTYPLIHINRGEQRVIGQFKVVATLDKLYDRLMVKAITILLGNGLKTFLVAGFMLILFYRLVTRHLLTIANFVENHDIERLEPSRLEIDYPINEKSNDELVVLTNHLNKMQEKISNSYAKLKSSEEKYRQLVEMAQEGIWVIDKEGITSFVNPAMANMLGYSVDEMTGKHLFDFMDEQGKEIAVKNMERRQDGIHETHDFELLRKDGNRVYTTMAAAPVYDVSGKYLGALAGVIDITKRVIAEKELLHQQQILEDTVFERTRALEISNKELEAFSYSVAHDLRTPLRSITSFSQILEEDELENLSKNGRDVLARIVRAGKGMSQLIDELLELSRITRAEIQFSRVNLSSLANNIINQLIEQSPDRKCKITISANLNVTADRVLIEILLQNLLQNAWKFTRSNKITDIEVGEKIIEGQTVYYVKDNGIGFDMKYQHKLFEAFQRLHDAEYSGSGIGLATVKRIINRHRGTIWAEAKENVGATFYFTIPDKPRTKSLTNKIKAVS